MIHQLTALSPVRNYSPSSGVSKKSCLWQSTERLAVGVSEMQINAPSRKRIPVCMLGWLSSAQVLARWNKKSEKLMLFVSELFMLNRLPFIHFLRASCAIMESGRDFWKGRIRKETLLKVAFP